MFLIYIFKNLICISFILSSIFLCISCLDASEPGNLVRKTVTQDSSLPSLEINDTKLHLETFGDPNNPTIIFLHGGPGNDYFYMTKLIEEYHGYSLADDYFLVLWDQRGSGLSQRHSNPSLLTLDVFLEDLELLVEQFAYDRQFIFLGHSWGGMYAAMYMNKHPQRVAGAILLESGEFSTELGEGLDDVDMNFFSEWLNDWMWGRQMINLGDHERADYYLAIAKSDERQQQRNDDPSPDLRPGAAVMIYLYLDEISNNRFDFTENLHLVEPEILFIAGGDTEDLGADFQEKQRVYFQHSRLEIIPNAGHNDLTWGAAEQSLELIRSYLESLDLSGAL